MKTRRIFRLVVPLATVLLLSGFAILGEIAARNLFGGPGNLREDQAFLARFRDAWEPYFRLEKIGGRRYLVQNPRLNVVMPPQTLLLERTPGVARVAVLGESSAVGLGRSMRDLIHDTDNAARFEILNCAVGGASLEIVERKFREVLRYQPDVIVLLFGHNLYVPYATVSPWIHRVRNFAKQSVILTRLANKIFRNPFEYIRTETRLADFDKSLRDMAQEARERNIRLVVCTVPSNLFFPPKSSESDKVHPSYLEATYQYALNNRREGIDLLRRASAQETVAPWHYQLGRWLFLERDFAAAYRHFCAARDFDPDRNRATTSVNAVIRKAALDEKLWFFDAEAWVETQAPNSIPGWESIQDQQHVWDDLYLGEAKEILRLWETNRWPSDGVRWNQVPETFPKDRTVASLLGELERRGREKTESYWFEAAASRFADVLMSGDKLLNETLEEEISKIDSDESPRQPGYRARLTLAYAQAHWASGRRDKAFQLLADLRRRVPPWEEPDVCEGLWRMETKELDRSIFCFRQSLRKNPQRADAAFYLKRLTEENSKPLLARMVPRK